MKYGNKKLFLGVDEAGYGPNLGPLVIAASAWLAPIEFQESELVHAFSQGFAPTPWSSDCQHVPLGDSKQLYQPGTGLRSLETGLLAMLHIGDHQPASLEALLEHHVIKAAGGRQTPMPWYASLHRFPVPCIEIPPSEISRLAGLAKQTLNKSGVELLAIRALVVDESVFNTEVMRLGSKAQLLSQQTLGLVADLLAEYPQPAEVFCDRQGGRKNYMPILVDALPEEWFCETAVSHARCSYRSTGTRSIDIHFSVGGDRFPPTALASMLAKYVRERLMESFNAFWRQHCPQIKPTAGYPVDAKRFRADIEAVANQLDFHPDHWWRAR